MPNPPSNGPLFRLSTRLRLARGASPADGCDRAMPKDTLSITDNRTVKTYEVAITDGAIRAPDLRQIRVDDQDFGLVTYDAGFLNTASCRSSITYIDGDKGILRYRGYPVDELAE